MTEPVTPKAERRVIDGEVVEPTAQPQTEKSSPETASTADANARRRAHNRTQQTSEPSASASSSTKNSKTSDNQAKKASVMSKPWVKKSLLWGSFFIMVAAILFYTRPNMDWQVEHINQLQVQVAQLKESNQSLAAKLEKQQAEMEARIAEVLNQPENQPLITQADLDAVTTDTKAQLSALYEQVQTDLTAFNNQAETKLQALAEQAKTALTPSDSDLSALAEFQQKVEGQLNQVGEEMSQLFTFKQQQEQKQPEVLAEPENVPHLTSMQVQQWMVDVNSQWLLKGDVELTQSQLFALEQALAITDVANKTEIARTIGQDLSDIKAYSQQTQQASQVVQKNLEALTRLVNAIPQPSMQREQALADSVSQTQEASQATQAAVSPLDTLLEKFTGLISVKKRESETELSSVEGLLLHDVLMQRLALLVDRVQWASSIQSTVELKKATASVQAFIDLHFSAQSQAFETVLTPLNTIEFNQRKPLAVVGLNAA